MQVQKQVELFRH